MPGRRPREEIPPRPHPGIRAGRTPPAQALTTWANAHRGTRTPGGTCNSRRSAGRGTSPLQPPDAHHGRHAHQPACPRTPRGTRKTPYGQARPATHAHQPGGNLTTASRRSARPRGHHAVGARRPPPCPRITPSTPRRPPGPKITTASRRSAKPPAHHADDARRPPPCQRITPTPTRRPARPARTSNPRREEDPDEQAPAVRAPGLEKRDASRRSAWLM